MPSGIYKITNHHNGKFYIGSSQNINKRWHVHLSLLRANKHNNPHLQNAYNKYGSQNFTLSVVMLTKDKKLMLQTEQQMIDTHIGSDNCYNINPGVTDLNGIHNPFYGKHHTETAKQKMSIAKKNIRGIYHPLYGRNLSSEVKSKISQSKIGKCGGINHPMFDPSIYTFVNGLKTYTGTRYDFCHTFNLHKGNICWLIAGKYKSVKGWKLVQ